MHLRFQSWARDLVSNLPEILKNYYLRVTEMVLEDNHIIRFIGRAYGRQVDRHRW